MFGSFEMIAVILKTKFEKSIPSFKRKYCFKDIQIKNRYFYLKVYDKAFK